MILVPCLLGCLLRVKGDPRSEIIFPLTVFPLDAGALNVPKYLEEADQLLYLYVCAHVTDLNCVLSVHHNPFLDGPVLLLVPDSIVPCLFELHFCTLFRVIMGLS